MPVAYWGLILIFSFFIYKTLAIYAVYGNSAQELSDSEKIKLGAEFVEFSEGVRSLFNWAHSEKKFQLCSRLPA